MSLITATDLVKEFGPNRAVDGMSLAVDAGEVVGLLGANGAGKSTLIRMILGMLAPTRGEVRLFGASPDRAARGRVGYVPQGLGLYPDLTVAENLEFAAHAFGSDPPQLSPELAAVADRLVGEMSLGVRRRVAFAAAMSHGPELLILDEPTSGVGPLGRAELWAGIGDVANGGAGVLVSTHHMDEAEQCDRIVMMATGRTVASGTTAEVGASVSTVEVAAPNWRRSYEILEAAGHSPTVEGGLLRLGSADPDHVRSHLEAAAEVAEVRVVPARFDEVFAALTVR